MQLPRLQEVLTKNRYQLLKKANVIATGIGYKITKGKKRPDLSLVCSVIKKLPAAQLLESDLVPPFIDDIPTDVIATGRINAQAFRTSRIRPSPGGVSIGHINITAGTLGCLVKKDGQIMLLSNNHVLANSNSAQIRDPILQPGPSDGGKYPKDQIASLKAFIPITFARLSGVNLIDAAVAKPLKENLVTSKILELGRISGLAKASLGMPICKSGRTTGLTSDEITQVDVTVNVQYGPNQAAVFSDQLMAGPMSQGGDSGSAVLDTGTNLVGLLFAGSDTTTIINRIENVFSLLKLNL